MQRNGNTGSGPNGLALPPDVIASYIDEARRAARAQRDPLSSHRGGPQIRPWLLGRPELSSDAKILYARLEEHEEVSSHRAYFGGPDRLRKEMLESMGMRLETLIAALNELMVHRLLEHDLLSGEFILVQHEWMETKIADDNEEYPFDNVESLPPPGPRTCFVYFMQRGEGGPIKIGYSFDPVKRRQALQQGVPERIKLLKTIEGDSVTERRLHKQFASLRMGKTEWFRPENELLEFIENINVQEDAAPQPLAESH